MAIPSLRHPLTGSLALVVALLTGWGMAPAAEAPTFAARTTEGKELRGRLVAITAAAVELRGETTHRLAADGWLSLTRIGLTRSPFPTEEQLILANGDRIPAQDVRLVDEKVHFRHRSLAGGQEVSLPIAAVSVIWRLPPDRVVAASRFRNRLIHGRRARDVVHLRNGDSVEGTLVAIHDADVQLDAGKKQVPIRWTQIAAIALSSELAERSRTTPRGGRLVLAASATSPGGVFTLTGLRGDGKTLSGTTAFGAALQAPLERVDRLEAVSPDVVELSALKPSGYTYSPYLDEKWGWKADAAVTDDDLVLAGRACSRGIGMHAPSRLTFALDGGYRRFDVGVGLDDGAGRPGRVRVQVLGDGKPLTSAEPGILTHASGAVFLNLPVAGVRTLTLVVDDAGRGNVGGVVNWVTPRLLR